MALVDYNDALVRRDRELAERNRRGPSLFRTKEQVENFQRSPFMQKVREHQLAVHNRQQSRDSERARTDPEFQPRDDDFGPPVRPSANENYYKYLGIGENATADQEAFEILGDQATRRQYDRQRISEEELDKQYDHRRNRRRENEENAWKPPPTWKPKLKELLKKGKKKRTPTKHVAVVVSLEDVLTGCERTVSFERTVAGRTGKLHTQTKTRTVEVRRGELASKKWEYPGEAGVCDVDAEPGDLVLALENPASSAVRRVGVDLEAERVVDCSTLAPGDVFTASIATLGGAAVAACGAPDGRAAATSSRGASSSPTRGHDHARREAARDPVTGAKANILLRRARRRRFHAISNEPQVILVCGNSGASVRSGPRVDSGKVGELAKDERVAYTGKQACGGRRIEIEPARAGSPARGPAPPDAEAKVAEESELE
ncbi:hypothetical protein JL720_17272 [Aureococcus anophagefferens]|nr:hypothetical protein JL720_17272 [Aureococcus anophagefferens]